MLALIILHRTTRRRRASYPESGGSFMTRVCLNSKKKTEIDTATTDAFHKAGLDSRVQERLEEVVREV